MIWICTVCKGKVYPVQQDKGYNIYSSLSNIRSAISHKIHRNLFVTWVIIALFEIAQLQDGPPPPPPPHTLQKKKKKCIHTKIYVLYRKIKMFNYNNPPLSCRGQITLSNIDKICPLAITSQISLISMHAPSLVKIPWHLLKLSSGNENMGMNWADNSVKICPLAIPNQISTISMHIPSLVKIHRCLLKLSSGNEIRLNRRPEGCTTDRRTDGQTHVRPTTP